MPLLPRLHERDQRGVHDTPGRAHGGDPGRPQPARERQELLRPRDGSLPLRVRPRQAAVRGVRPRRPRGARGEPDRHGELFACRRAGRGRNLGARRVARRRQPQLRAAPAPPRDDGARAGTRLHRSAGHHPPSHRGRPHRSRAFRGARSPTSRDCTVHRNCPLEPRRAPDAPGRDPDRPVGLAGADASLPDAGRPRVARGARGLPRRVPDRSRRRGLPRALARRARPRWRCRAPLRPRRGPAGAGHDHGPARGHG